MKEREKRKQLAAYLTNLLQGRSDLATLAKTKMNCGRIGNDSFLKRVANTYTLEQLKKVAEIVAVSPDLFFEPDPGQEVHCEPIPTPERDNAGMELYLKTYGAMAESWAKMDARQREYWNNKAHNKE